MTTRNLRRRSQLIAASVGLVVIASSVSAVAETVLDPSTTASVDTTVVDPTATDPGAVVTTATNVHDLSTGQWTVPANVDAVQVVAIGAKGGGALPSYTGGPGCKATGSVPVTSGQVVAAVIGQVGGTGQNTGGTDGYDFAGGAGGAGAFPGGDGGQAWSTGSDLYPFRVPSSGGGGGGGATGVTVGDDGVDDTYVVVGSGGSGASSEFSSRTTYQCNLIMYPRNFGYGGLNGMGGSTAEGGAYSDYSVTPPIPYPLRGGFWTQAGNYLSVCGSGTRSARAGGDGGLPTDPAGGVGGKGADAGWFFQGGTCVTPRLDRSFGAGGGGGGGWSGGGGGASGSDGSTAGVGGPGISLVPRTATESADFATADGVPAGAVVKWVTIDSTLPAGAATPGTAVSTTLSASFGDGTPYVISLYSATAVWNWTATGLPAGWTINASTGALSGTVPATGVNVTVTAEYRVSSWNPTYSYGLRTVAKSHRVYRIGPAAPLLPTDLTYTGTTGTVTAGTSVTLSSSVTPAECTSTVTYAISGPDGFSLDPATDPVDTTGWADGTYTVTATYPEDLACATDTATATFSIGTSSTTPVTVAADPLTITYGDTPSLTFGASGFASGDNWVTEPKCTVFDRGEPPAEVLVSPIPAGTYDIVCSGGDPGYGYEVTSFTDGELVVSKADVDCTVIGYDVVFDGEEHTSDGTCAGVGEETPDGLSVTGTSHTTGGEYTDTWTFTDETGNYNDTSGTVGNIIRPAAPTVTYTGGSGLIVAGSSVPLSATISPTACPGPIGFTLTSPNGTVTTVVSPLDTTGFAGGIYTITAIYETTSSCTRSTDEAVLVFGSPGDSTTGGGWYRVDPSISGNPRVNFGFTVQKTVQVDKRSGLTTTTYRGQLLWMNSQAWRVKGSVYSRVVTDGVGNVISGGTPAFVVFGCPSDVGTLESRPSCGIIAATATMQRYNALTGTWDTVLSGDRPAQVIVNATIFDGGQLTTCKLKRCTTADLADSFGLAISSVTSADGIPVAAPTTLANSKQGQIVIRRT